MMGTIVAAPTTVATKGRSRSAEAAHAAPSPTGRSVAPASREPAGAAATRARRRVPPRRPGRRLIAWDRGLGVRFVAGADEAGRGCLAGPLVAAAVLFDYERLGPREVRALGALNDSKQHSEAGREELLPVIMRIATTVAVVSRSARGIDSRGLHVTNLAALADALRRVIVPGAIALCDGFAVAAVGCDQRAVIGGDATSAAIAAASVVAKVTRDRYMRRADALHPGWEFARHVGYATPEHRAAIMSIGVSPLHRLSFQSTAYQQLEL